MARRTITARRSVASGSSGELVPEGIYDAVINDVEEVQVKQGVNKGEPMYKVECKITGPTQVGRKATKWVCLFPGKEGKALISYYQLASALGENISFDENGDDEQEVEIMDAKELLNEPVRISITHEPGKEPADGSAAEMTYKLARFKAPNDDAPKAKTTGAKKTTRGKSRVKI